MIAGLLLAGAAAMSSGADADASFGVSLRIVEACDVVTVANPTCVGPEYDRWLDRHARTRLVEDEQGRQVIEVRF